MERDTVGSYTSALNVFSRGVRQQTREEGSVEKKMAEALLHLRCTPLTFSEETSLYLARWSWLPG